MSRGQAVPVSLSSCAQYSLITRRQLFRLASLLLHILFSSARARKRSSGEVILCMSSIVYGGGPGGAMFGVRLRLFSIVSRLQVSISSTLFGRSANDGNETKTDRPRTVGQTKRASDVT
jgi:hypothetical protein